MWLSATIADHVAACIPCDVYKPFRAHLEREELGSCIGDPEKVTRTIASPPGFSSTVWRGSLPVQAGPGGPRPLMPRSARYR